MAPPRKRYDEVALELFRRKFVSGEDKVTFSREELLACASSLGIQIRNLGDFVYHFGKRGVLPDELRSLGFEGVAISGRSVYAFVKQADVIDVPKDTPETEISVPLPVNVRRFLTGDEQSVLVKVRAADALSMFLGEKVFHLQSHLRTQSEEFGQVEIDDVYVLEESGKVCTVEALEPNEKTIRSQIARQVAGAAEKFGVARQDVVPVAIRIIDPSKIVMLLLNSQLTVHRARRYRFTELGGQAR